MSAVWTNTRSCADLVLFGNIPTIRFLSGRFYAVGKLYYSKFNVCFVINTRYHMKCSRAEGPVKILLSAAAH